MRKEIIRDMGKSGRKKIENTGGGEIRELTLLTLLSDSARDTVLRKTTHPSNIPVLDCNKYGMYYKMGEKPG